MKTAIFITGNQYQSELNDPRRLQPVSSLQAKKHSTLISGIQKQTGIIRAAFSIIINSAISYKPVNHWNRIGYSGRSFR